MPPERFAILGQSLAVDNWNGAPLTLAVHDSAIMPQTTDGSMILAFQNASTMNNAGKLALTSGGGQPQFLLVPALLQQPSVMISNWHANNLNLTNISVAANTPIWIEAYGPGMPGQTPAPLPIGTPVPVAVGGTLQTVTSPRNMQLCFQAQTLSLFAIIGGPADINGNNAYAVAVNSSSGDTGPGTGNPAPQGYYGTAGGNNYSFEFNWGSSVLFVASFGSGTIVPDKLAGTTAPTVMLQAL